MARQNTLSVSKNANASTKEDLNKKRLRNRLSQQTYRRRQADRLRDLRDHANHNGKPEDESNRVLREENRRLRQSIIELQSKLARLAVTVQSLSETASNALVDPSRDEPSTTFDSCQGNTISASATEEAVSIPTPALVPRTTSRRRTLSAQMIQYAAQDADNEQELFARAPNVDSSPAFNIAANFNSLAQQIPSIWNFEYQMGPGPYTNCLAANEESSVLLGRAWTESNSPFSDHIHVLQSLMKARLNSTILFSGSTIHQFYQEILMVLALFNSMTRPDVMRWYARTRFYHIVNLTAWQVCPCSLTFDSIHSQYQPTVLQTRLQNQYPKVIDWIPFPTIRDRLIQLHAANPRIDQIFCDVVSSYIAEAWMSDLIAGAPTIKVHIRVTDLVQNIDPSASMNRSDTASSVSLPAPDVATLFASPEYSLAVFHHLGMDLGVSNYKIDPAFFATYPELYDHNACISGEGIPLRPDAQARLTCPIPLDSKIFQTYRNFIDFCYGWQMCG